MHDELREAVAPRQDVGVSGDDFDKAREWIGAAKQITVFTGAGISTDSGIPDFRGPNGVWTKNPAAEKASTLQNYLADPEVRRFAWQNRLHSPAWTAVPNSGHLAIYELERQGRLRAVVTQNIDELHQQAGHRPGNVIEVHGTMRWTRCWTCDDRRPMHESLERVRAGEDDPHCLVCDVGVVEERHDLVRPVAGARGDRRGDAGRRRVRSAAGRRLDVDGVPGGQRRAAGEGQRRTSGDRQRRADRDGPIRRRAADRSARRAPAGT